ncbi:MAG: 16S rRNA (cytosine(967)-C(5))-methyltransferase RsmB [Gammaproteobacteria bacterium]|nr:16S rRNA (cytosine(967)-C(5))-methyltransferase RsmB [Gammaproteobacteria bacterium]
MNKKKSGLLDVRAAAVQVLLKVLVDGQSCSRVLPELSVKVADKERALLQELTYGVLRWQVRLQCLRDLLLDKPLRAKDRDIDLLIQLGLYQLEKMTIAPHAVVQETVKVAVQRRKNWARGLVNALLRRFLREKDALLTALASNERAIYSHPDWMLDRLRTDWPAHWREIAEADNQRPPMSLRVNLHKTSRNDYLQSLSAAGLAARVHPLVDSAVMLETPVNVGLLPGFAEGLVSVQDAGAQLAAGLLAPAAGARVLDACAAPGGKTCHLLESSANDLQLLALDEDPARCELIEDNLRRLGLTATVVSADASNPADWWDGELFDVMLLDVPCSALGVIRRHPDIKALRKETDVAGLIRRQEQILMALWPLLKPGGRMLYATCSLVREENDLQILRFVDSQEDAQRITIGAGWGVEQPSGRQILTGQHEMDGFYYSLIEKQVETRPGKPA